MRRGSADTKLAPPRYGSASLADLLPSAIAAILGEEPAALDLGNATAVIVVVADGLGAHQLDRHADAAPFLTSQPTRIIDAPFPSTTATALTTIGTGRPAGQHGIVGFTMGMPDETQPLNLLSWRIGLRGGGADARERYVPETLQPHPTQLERAQAAGIATTAVLHPDFLDSGLTRAGLRGGERVAATGLANTLTAAVAAGRRGSPALVYAHHGEIDSAGHAAGPGSDRWCDAVQEFDRELERVADGLPSGALLLVTADHGMLPIPEDEVFELADHPQLAEGVRLLAGEPRVRHVYCRPGATGDVAAAWREVLGDRAIVAPRDAAIGRGWFGAVDPSVVPRIGDLLVVARVGTVVHHRVDPHHGRQAGQHGGLTKEELEVPLIRIGD
ncbi:MAG: alkaline phosphatase family protein [Nitriliruptorales bacterium]|nr:alkaline phosphatase family protein [Nitriliruptorales bacterium]